MDALTMIVFAREPIAGRTKTRLARAIGAENAAALADAFIRDALPKARSVGGARLVIAGSSPDGARRSRYFRELASRFSAQVVDQGSGDLGARMARVLMPFARRGKAILIGTDAPSLPRSVLVRCARTLDDAELVIAPTLDGGYYLIGARGRPPDIFTQVKWGGAGVLRATLAHLRRAGASYALGPWWYDVDRPADLAFLSAHLKHHLNSRWLWALPLPRHCPCPVTARLLSRLGL